MSKKKIDKEQEKKFIAKDFDVLKEAKERSYYKRNFVKRNEKSRETIEELRKSRRIFEGALLYFNYFRPKLAAELEYYDARPTTIFFGIINTQDGKRVLGFNLHYFPMQWRGKILNFVLKEFNRFYSGFYETPVKRTNTRINYRLLLDKLEKAKLGFGVRMYDPHLMNNIINVPVSKWPEVIMTEGYFKKVTREAIKRYWQNFRYK